MKALKKTVDIYLVEMAGIEPASGKTQLKEFSLE